MLRFPSQSKLRPEEGSLERSSIVDALLARELSNNPPVFIEPAAPRKETSANVKGGVKVSHQGGAKGDHFFLT